MAYTSFVDNVLEQSARHPQRVFLHQPHNGEWKPYNWALFEDHCRRVATGLRAYGFAKGTCIGIMAKNCAEWFIADIAITMAGMVSVPIYTTANAKTISYVIEHSDMQALFVGKLDGTEEAQKAIPDSLTTIAMPYPTLECKEQWLNWLEQFTPLQDIHRPEIDELMTIVYTSGSTGVPKGVPLTHRNLAAAVESTVRTLDITEKDRCMSYLPLAHITERSVIEGTAYKAGGQVYFVESLDTFIDNVQYAEPTKFISVPRLWLKFQSQILAKMPEQKLQTMLRIPLLGKMVAYKIRKAMGLHKCDSFGSGTAPISLAVLEWFERIGMPISEGWGMTEAAGLACSNSPPTDGNRGTIGRPLDCIDMKLSDEGEILISGDCVFSEYYRAPEETEKSFVDGWFRTGDRGEITPEGDFKIIGRVKEQFKTAKGKYVAPVPIESLLYANSAIEQVCVVGAGLKQPVALVVVNEAGEWQSDIVSQELIATLTEVNSQLESHERLDHLLVCPEAWSPENDLLTPTLKIKRPELEAYFADAIEQAADTPVVWLPKQA